jgi:hypothetical protein
MINNLEFFLLLIYMYHDSVNDGKMISKKTIMFVDEPNQK